MTSELFKQTAPQLGVSDLIDRGRLPLFCKEKRCFLCGLAGSIDRPWLIDYRSYEILWRSKDSFQSFTFHTFPSLCLGAAVLREIWHGKNGPTGRGRRIQGLDSFPTGRAVVCLVGFKHFFRPSAKAFQQETPYIPSSFSGAKCSYIDLSRVFVVSEWFVLNLCCLMGLGFFIRFNKGLNLYRSNNHAIGT